MDNYRSWFVAIFAGFMLFVSLRASACESPPSAVVNLDVNNYYIDKKFSIIDPVRKAKHDTAVRPLDTFIQLISKQSDEYIQNPKLNIQQGQCAFNWISDWAKAAALTGEMKTEQAFYERKWMLTGIALVYAKVRALGNPDDKAIIHNWLMKLADLTIEHSDHQKWPRNNHYYWEALAVGAVGKLTDQPKYIQWAENAFTFAMNEIQEDGSLTKEIARGQRALHYHLFSAAPLVFLSSILNKNSPKLKLLVEFTFLALNDSARITKMAGVSQDIEKERDMAWLEIYLRRYPDLKMENFVKPKRPMFYSKLGGNLTLLNPLECPTSGCLNH